MSAAAAAVPGPVLVPKRSLFAHVREVEDLADLVDQLDRKNELTPEAAEELSAALCASIAGTKTKVDRTSAVLAAFEEAEKAALAKIKSETERLQERAAYFARQRARLEDHCLAVLTASNLDQLDGETSSITRRRNPPKVDVYSPELVPWEFMRWPEPKPDPPAEPDKKLIAAALKVDPDSVPGARLQAENYRLVRS